VVSRDSIAEHIVYVVKDGDGRLRYIGEGKEARWKHVNSGASHNVKINEHFFTKGPMTVEVIQEGLTKPEALSIERLLLARHAGQGLWNSKDYEPYYEHDSHRITQEEMAQYLQE
jgi:predicted GIY-YIG superfamily endonuclease